MPAHLIYLGCSCPGAPGWTAWLCGAATPAEAVAKAVRAASTCCRCGEVHAESEDRSAADWRRDPEPAHAD